MLVAWEVPMVPSIVQGCDCVEEVLVSLRLNSQAKSYTPPRGACMLQLQCIGSATEARRVVHDLVSET